MNYSVLDILSITNGSHLCGPKNNLVKSISIDSRRIWAKECVSFIALKGVNFNGHDFIENAYKKGVRTFVVSEPRSHYSDLPHADFILVKDTVFAIQKLAKNYRDSFSFPLIGITGSNGKTIVKEWLAQSCNEKFRVVKTPKSYNSQVGVPLSIFEIEQGHTLGVFEAGISKPGEMQNLAKILQPNIGVFTNIGNAHAEFLKDQAEKALEKVKLFNSCETIVFCADVEDVSFALNLIPNKTVSWSLEGKGDINYSLSKQGDNSTLAKAENREFLIPFRDKVSIQNCLHVITVMELLNFSVKEINEKLLELKQVRMRLEHVEGRHGAIFINDVYNSDLNSFEAAIDLLKREKTKQNKSLILSEIKNTGFSPKEIGDFIKVQVSNMDLQSVHLIGENISEYANAFEKKMVSFYKNTNEFLERIQAIVFKDSAVLIKGSRLYQLEKITSSFQKKTHKTLLEVNLSQIQENLNFYRSKLKSNVELIVMVKAFSYGSGSHEIARVLEDNNVDYLAVAYVDEGVALREKNIQLPIMVMNPEDPQVETLITYNLQPVIYSFESLEHYAPYSQEIQIHIKIDTGMHRLGFATYELNDLSISLKKWKFNVISVFTHLAASGENVHDQFTKNQLDKFREVKAILQIENTKYHALNTAGISRFLQYQFDMVRLGIGLYGSSQIEEERKFLKRAVRLRSSVSQIKTVRKGESVGYSRNYIAKKEMSIGIVPIGYADGIHRSFGNGNGSVFINGKIAKTVGNICMDMCMINLSNIKSEVGNDVEFFGENKDIEETAKEMGTISYEVLANVSQRVKRVFYFD